MPLRSFPDGTHWHFRRPGEKGTLEATWSPRLGRLWLSTRAGRESPWQLDVISAWQDAAGV